MKNSQSKKVSLITKFIAMFAIFGVVAMLVSGIFTFMIQTQIYHRECESRLKNITNQLNALITDDGDDFVNVLYYSESTNFSFCPGTRFMNIPMACRRRPMPMMSCLGMTA
ncbi:MAG: hypothetical protein IJT32_05215 [Lachnospiraceae bacterium]|nr:hypothetical protein [Lachnospiraceae bacterium]